MNINVMETSYLDQRFLVKANITTLPSAIKFPFFTACYLIPKSKKAEYLSGEYDDYTFYKINESDYATKALGGFLDGCNSFYGQQHTNANLGIVIFEDSFALDTEHPETITQWVDAPQHNRLAVMKKVIDAIGRNAIYIGVAVENIKIYNTMIDDLRQIDTDLAYLKCKVVNSLIAKESDMDTIITDFKSFGATMIGLQNIKASSDSDTLPFKNRLDFMIAGALLNPYKNNTTAESYVVGVMLDGLNAVVTDTAGIKMDKTRDTLDYMTEQSLSYLQVRADDNTEYVFAGGGIYYQGQLISSNMFLLAKYATYVLKTNLFNERQADKTGVANVSIYRNALKSTDAILKQFVGLLIENYQSRTLTQTEINSNIVDGKLTIANAISITTYPVVYFQEATLSILVQ